MSNHRSFIHVRHILILMHRPPLTFPQEAARKPHANEALPVIRAPAPGPCGHPASTRVGINTDPRLHPERRSFTQFELFG
nr:hypothetical protein SHINE37_41093 [Rhizobiaceae bacterium]